MIETKIKSRNIDVHFLNTWEEISKYSSITWLKLAVSYITISSILSSLFKGVNKICFDKYECLDLTLPFNWKFLFFGSLLYILGFYVFHKNCPKFTKKYPNFSDFSNSSYIVSDVIDELFLIEKDILKETNRSLELENNLQEIVQTLKKYEEQSQNPELINSGIECVDLMANELIDGMGKYSACYNIIINTTELLNDNIYKIITYICYYIFLISLVYSLFANIFNVII